MTTKDELCKKIERVFPSVGSCGVDFGVEYDEYAHAWSMELHHENRHLRTFIETDEVKSCLEENSCIPLVSCHT